MNRITQQERVYEAERCMPLPLKGSAFTGQHDVQAWLTNELCGSDWWPERFPWVRGVECTGVTRGDSVGAWHSDTQFGQVEMSRVHLNVQMLCHEVAHVVCEAQHSTGHDPLFVRTYLELVYRCLGEASWTELRSLFLRHRVCIDERCQVELACRCGEERPFCPDPIFQ